LDNLNLDRVHEIYKERFADADDFTFTFIGNFDPTEITPMLSKYLGTLPTKPDSESFKDLNINIVDGVVNKKIKNGKAPKTTVNIVYHGKYDYDKKLNYELKSMVDIMRIKLRESMREDKGGVYGVRVSSNTSKVPQEKYSITISFNSDPDKTQELLDTALQDIGNLMSNGPEQTDVDKVKETQRQEQIKNLKQNRFWMNSINNALKLDGDMSKITIEDMDMAREKLTAKDIQNAAKKFLNAQSRVEIIMEPEQMPNN
jgi:zinc protease